MFRKIFISVLADSAGGMASAGLTEFARCGFTEPWLIPSYLVVFFSSVGIVASIRKLSQVDRETKQEHNRRLHQVKWAGLATGLSVMLVKSLVRVWYIGTAQGQAFVDVSWWQYLWIVFMVAALGSAGLALYLRWADRPFPPGHCSKCGYNLTGLSRPRCPECGTGLDS